MPATSMTVPAGKAVTALASLYFVKLISQTLASLIKTTFLSGMSVLKVAACVADRFHTSATGRSPGHTVPLVDTLRCML